jgi:hypothetical protein
MPLNAYASAFLNKATTKPWNAYSDVRDPQVVWDCENGSRTGFADIVSVATPVRPADAKRRCHAVSGTVKLPTSAGKAKWRVGVEEDGTLVRDGCVGDMVAWVVEHEGKVVMNKNANSTLRYRYGTYWQ